MKYNYTMNANDYKTPPELYQKALKFIGQEHFSCDVCCSERNIPAIIHFIDGERNGLTEDWEYYNWCNPPFNEAKKWIEKPTKNSKKATQHAC